MNILIIGSGMYVTGKGGQGVGTVLSSLAETSKTIPINRILIAARSPDNKAVIASATQRINSLLNTQIQPEYLQLRNDDTENEIHRICHEHRLDGAIVSTPDHVHYAPLKALIKNQVHSMVVKPFVPSLAEAKSLIALQKQHPMLGVVEFHKRHDESNLYAQKTVRSGDLGQLLYADVNYSQRIIIPTEIFSDWADKTNIFQYLAVHYVDLLYFITGYRPKALCAYGTQGILQQKGINTHDSVHAMIEWQHPENPRLRFISQFNTNWVDPNCTSAMSDQSFKIVGTQGRIECDQKHRGIELVCQNHGVVHPNPYFSDYLPDGNGAMRFQGYGHKSIHQFIEDISQLKQGRAELNELNQHRPTFADALVSTSVIDSVNQALQEHPNWRAIHDLS